MTTPPGFANDGPLISSWPRVLLQVAWNAGGNSTSPNHWYTISNRLRGSWKATLSGRQYELDAVQSGSMSFKLDNLDGAFDPDNTSSFFSPYVVPYRRCRLVLMGSPTKNLLYPWMASGTATTSQAASAGTLGTATGVAVSPSGLTTAVTWAVPNGTASGAIYGLTGASQSWTTTDCNGVTVTPGLTYSTGVDLSLAAGGMASLGVQVQLVYYNLAGSIVGGTASATQTLTTTWQRISVSSTAPATAAFAILAVVTEAATTAATTVQATGWQIEQAASPTSWVSSGTWNQLWQGFVERWPQKYAQGGKYGEVEVTAVDALAPLSQLTLANAMPQSVAAQSPQYRWDLATTGASPDVANGKAFLDLGGTGAALDIVGSNIATGVSISSTKPTGTLWNTPGPVITLSNNQANSLGNSANGTYLRPYASGNNVLLPSAGWTRMICFRTTAVPGGSNFSTSTLWAATAPGYQTGSGDQSGVQLGLYYANGATEITLQASNAAGTSTTYLGTPILNVSDGNWHCAILSLSADGKTFILTVDDSEGFNPTGSSSYGSSTYTNDAIGTLLVGASTNTQPFNGDLAWFAQWNTALPQSVMNDLSSGFATGWAVYETSNNRYSRIATLANFHPGASTTLQSKGSSASFGGISVNGRSPLDVLQECVDTECGQFAIDRLGVPTIYGQLWRWIQSSPIVTFGENTASGEIPYLDDIAFEQDPAHLFNDIQITCDGAADSTSANQLQEVQDTTSQSSYFPQTLQRTINPNVVQGGTNIANYLLSQFKDPHTRLNGLTVDLAGNPSALNSVAGLNFSDLVQVNRRPALAPSKSLACFIEQMEWSGDDTGANLKVHFQMSPVNQYQYGVISAAWAKLTGPIAAGVNVITVGPIQGNSGIAAQCVIPPNYQMTLGYGTANQETVTVQSVQAVSAGYTSVQLTLTANTTKSHALNDVICDPKPGNAAIPPVGTYPSCFDAVSLTGGSVPLIGF